MMLRTPDALRDLRVLVVEDEALIAEEIRDRLARLGMTVLGPVDSAAGAVTTATNSSPPPELVLMDIRLRGGDDGIEAASRIRATIDVPVVYVTAHSDRATFERAKASSPFGYVLKPFHERELIVAMEMALYRHSIDRQLHDRQRHYAATLTSIADGVMAVDLNGRITFMNAVAEAMTQWTLAEARGLPLEEVFHVAHDDGIHIVSPLRQALNQQGTVRFDASRTFLISRSRDAVPIDSCAAPIVDELQSMRGAVVAFRDVRDRRLAEDALRRAQDELFQAEKMEAVGRLAAGIAHDFNNLLTIINGCTELAAASPVLDATTRALLDEVTRAGRRAAALTRQFLAFGRKQMLEPRVFDLNRLIGEIVVMLQRVLGARTALTVELSDGSLPVRADPTQIEHVLVNLINNARDATIAGGVVTLKTGRRRFESPAESAASDFVLVSVTDSGKGIEENVQRRIFEPYFTTKEVGKGSGLGLATVYGIVKQSSGFVEVESQPGQGTTFAVYLPAAEGVPTDESVIGPSRLATEARGKGVVLLVEDEDAVRTFVARVLQRNGYEVLEASTAEQAREIFGERHAAVDLVVSDVVMPDATGPEIMASLAVFKPDVRVLYISGYAEDPQAFAGAAFLSKPFTGAAFITKVQEILNP